MPRVRGRDPASAPRRGSASAPLHLSAVLTHLSATVSLIRGLQQRHANDGLAGQLHRTAAELEELITRLLHTDGSGPGPSTARQPSVRTPRQQAVEQAFLLWLAEPTDANDLQVVDGEEPEPLDRILGELSRSPRRLPADTAATLGLVSGTTVGRAAAEILLAVKDPAGPRCRSFRAACYYLHDLDRDRFLQPDGGEVFR